MAEGKSAGVPLDLERLRELIALMEKHDLSEVDLQNGEQRCRLRRGPQNVSVMSAPQGYLPQPMAMAPAPVAPQATNAAPAAPAAPVNDGTILIKCPTVGTFYIFPKPDDPPYVKVGSTVKADTIVCQIEAMKVYSQITADVTGTITEILVNNGDPVEFDQPLFRVKP